MNHSSLLGASGVGAGAGYTEAVGRWLRVWFALLALFGPAALVPEAQARPVAVSVGGGAPVAEQRFARPPRVTRDAVEPTALAVVAAGGHLPGRPLYLLNRSLLH